MARLVSAYKRAQNGYVRLSVHTREHRMDTYAIHFTLLHRMSQIRILTLSFNLRLDILSSSSSLCFLNKSPQVYLYVYKQNWVKCSAQHSKTAYSITQGCTNTTGHHKIIIGANEVHTEDPHIRRHRTKFCRPVPEPSSITSCGSLKYRREDTEKTNTRLDTLLPDSGRDKTHAELPKWFRNAGTNFVFPTSSRGVTATVTPATNSCTVRCYCHSHSRHSTVLLLINSFTRYELQIRFEELRTKQLCNKHATKYLHTTTANEVHIKQPRLHYNGILSLKGTSFTECRCFWCQF